MNVRLAVLLALLSSVTANAQAVPSFVRPRSPNETPLPKVVFFGDGYTAGWPLPAGSNWINEGQPGIDLNGLDSNEAVAAFESDVVSQHPAIVHIMVGYNDALEADDATYAGTTPQYINNIATMVNEAKAANIKVILGNISESGGYTLATDLMNAALDAYGAANGIQVINYSDALCGCVGSLGGSGIGSTYATGPNGYVVAAALLVTSTGTTNSTSDGGYVPTAAGYALMTQMAETAIANLILTLKSGYLQDVTLPTYDFVQPYANVNSVSTGQFLQFTPFGLYSDGSTHEVVNSTFAGLSGTWTSSNPLVMNVTQTGKASALTPGTAIIKYTAPNGVPFSEWIMYVSTSASE
jgi:lysophospholipase L1-like esterase